MVRVGRDLWGSSSPFPLPEQVHLDQLAQDLVHVGFEYLQYAWNSCLIPTEFGEIRLRLSNLAEILSVVNAL